MVHDLTLANIFDGRVYISFVAEIASSHSRFLLCLERVKFVPIFCTCYSICLQCCSPSSSFCPQCLLREAFSDFPIRSNCHRYSSFFGISSRGFSLFVIVSIVNLFPYFCLFQWSVRSVRSGAPVLVQCWNPVGARQMNFLHTLQPEVARCPPISTLLKFAWSHRPRG